MEMHDASWHGAASEAADVPLVLSQTLISLVSPDIGTPLSETTLAEGSMIIKVSAVAAYILSKRAKGGLRGTRHSAILPYSHFGSVSVKPTACGSGVYISAGSIPETVENGRYCRQNSRFNTMRKNSLCRMSSARCRAWEGV